MMMRGVSQADLAQWAMKLKKENNDQSDMLEEAPPCTRMIWMPIQQKGIGCNGRGNSAIRRI